MSLRSAIRDLESALSRLDDPATARDAIQAVISVLMDIDQRLVTLEGELRQMKAALTLEGGERKIVPLRA